MRHLSILLLPLLWLSACAGCDADRLEQRGAVHLDAIAFVQSAPPVTTTTTVAAGIGPRTRPPASRAKAMPPPHAEPAGDVWWRLALCESGGDTRSIGGGGRFYGALQFTLSSWHSVGMAGNPIDYDWPAQRAAGIRLQARSGWRNWPVCSRRVGVA